MNKKTEMINQPTKTNTNNMQYYTMAELSEISKNNGEIDLKKISPELMGIINLVNKSGKKAVLNAVELPADDLTDKKIMTDEEKQVLDEKLKSLKIMQLESILKEKYGESYSALPAQHRIPDPEIGRRDPLLQCITARCPKECLPELAGTGPQDHL